MSISRALFYHNTVLIMKIPHDVILPSEASKRFVIICDYKKGLKNPYGTRIF